MPELSRFEGMVIYMLFRDNKEHNKPHVHVYYGEYKEEAYAAWNLAVTGEHFEKIRPM